MQKLLIMTLDQVKTKQEVYITEIPSSIKAELIRLGLCCGDKLTCVAKIPQGPIVLQKDLIEVAIGNNYAKQITVNA